MELRTQKGWAACVGMQVHEQKCGLAGRRGHGAGEEQGDGEFHGMKC